MAAIDAEVAGTPIRAWGGLSIYKTQTAIDRTSSVTTRRRAGVPNRRSAPPRCVDISTARPTTGSTLLTADAALLDRRLTAMSRSRLRRRSAR